MLSHVKASTRFRDIHFVCACVRVCVHERGEGKIERELGACIWRSEVNFRCPSLATPLLSEVRSHWPTGFWGASCFYHCVAFTGLQDSMTTPALYVESELGLTLVRQACYHAGILPTPWFDTIFIHRDYHICGAQVPRHRSGVRRELWGVSSLPQCGFWVSSPGHRT